MNFCSACGAPVLQKIPEGDNRIRFVCSTCDQIHYQNPNIVAGTLPYHGNEVLLCKRAIEPRMGFWTLPAGFMENKETVKEAALRETLEEAHACINNASLYTVINVPHVDQVHIFYLGEISEGKFGAGIETIEAQLFKEEDIPWGEIAFKTVYITLKHYFADRRMQSFPVRVEDVRPREK
jgi:ADP-ribose pyrophosphatase YjhB (NUDIX family)